jgi:hypothetical protein
VSDSTKCVPHGSVLLWFAVLSCALLPSIAAAAQVVEPQTAKDSPRIGLESSPQIEEAPAAATCAQVVELLQQQHSLFTRELAQIRREVVVLKETIAQPGLKEVFSGIGYIFGFAGIALYFHSKRSRKDL